MVDIANYYTWTTIPYLEIEDDRFELWVERTFPDRPRKKERDFIQTLEIVDGSILTEEEEELVTNSEIPQGNFIQIRSRLFALNLDGEEIIILANKQ